LDQPLRLAALASACSIVDAALPEREPHPEIFADLDILVTRLTEETGAAGDDGWLADYVRWELTLLADLGFGLDLTHCAVTGETEGLTYVSPKTGRAVTQAAGQGYHDRLLPLPPFLAEGHTVRPDRASILDGLRLTGHFLARHVFTQNTLARSGPGAGAAQPAGGEGPMARRQFLQRLHG
jgi:DNA repair protein RecO (recombination protein O)